MNPSSTSGGLVGGSESSPPDEAWQFVQDILEKPNPSSRETAQRSHRNDELLEFAASISHDVRHLRVDAMHASRNCELLEWLAPLSEKHERQLHELQRDAAIARDARQRLNKTVGLREAQWNAAKHPRRGTAPNAGWFATTGGSSSAARGPRLRSASVVTPPRTAPGNELTVTPRMIRSSGWLSGIREKLRVAGDVASAFVSGLGTGAKAVVNGLATAARSVATLGLNTDQLELIGVTKEDRERGYDTAVTISTGSGQVLIAVGTGGMASALAKGGTIARAASGAMVAFDSAGNAVGVVQGVFDASQNGVTLANGTQVAASALGLSANISAAKGLVKPRCAGSRGSCTESAFVSTVEGPHWGFPRWKARRDAIAAPWTALTSRRYV